jgi:hypothetical protein
VTAGRDDTIADVDIDIVPMRQTGGDLLEARNVGGAKIFQRLIREDHAPAERVVSPVALENRDVELRPGLLDQQSEVQTGRPPANHRKFHGDISGTKHNREPVVRAMAWRKCIALFLIIHRG